MSMSDTDTTFVFSDELKSWISSEDYPIPNRAMNFGDGVFETMVFDQNQIRFSEFHQDRALRGLEALGIKPTHFDMDLLQDFLATRFSGSKLRARWNLFRSGSGKYTPLENSLSQTLHLELYKAAPRVKPIAGISDSIRLCLTPWSPFKTLNSIPYIMAAQERQNRGWDEILLLDAAGRLSEAGASNLFWQSGNEIFTPSLDCACIGGVSRQVIMEEAEKNGFGVREGSFYSSDLDTVERVWVSNVTGVSYLKRIESNQFSTEGLPWLDKLFE
jgi:4-amino-4-deoxychorismate lyase